jgi:hypothetical protein
MIRLVLALGALVGLMWLASWLGKATPAQRSRALKMILLYGVAGVLLLLVVTGRIHWMFAAVSAALPWLQRALMARRVWQMFKSTRGPASGQVSKVETAFLRMTLDHDSGDLAGEVIAGAFAGQQLEQMSLDNLLDLLSTCQAQDAQSAALLETYLDRHHGENWRVDADTEDTATVPPSGHMSRREAAEILGVPEDASNTEIKAAHRRLIQRLHSDRGGSDYLATLINQARETMTS